MIQKFKTWIQSKLFVSDEIITNRKVSTQQCNIRDIEVRKRVKKAFEQQAQAMNARAMMPHDPTCKDPVSCTKKKCFKWEPDLIVSDPYEVKIK